MRTLTSGSIVLGFVVVLLSWDVSKRFIHVSPLQLAASIEVGDRKALSFAPQSQAPSAPADVGTKSSVGTSASASGEAPKSVAGLIAGAQRATPETSRRFGDAPALPVRQFTPGSKAHAEAIVTAIDSEESRNTVAPLARLYFAFFDRAADYEGLNYYIDERHFGSSLEAIADEFAGSDEFRIRYGSLDNAAYFDRVYRNIFDAVPDSAQRASWIAQLDAGMSRGQLMVAFSESGAFQAATSNEVFVTMAYAEALRREPDPAGFARWVRFLDAGNPREAVIAGLLGGTRTKR